ncbi:Imm41 family immunity protein [Avibacterium paragallinarum]|uniref:Imm41 family immunity protein n=1 Tax=Avibacterium paragallinarum TaxID=728 RepID=UPI00397B1823
MKNLLNFYRNITFFKEYDENSFIGRWLDYSEWDDEEYWKLEKDLLKIAYKYRKTHIAHQDILIGIMRIIQLLIIPDWNVFIVSNKDDMNIYDRYERFKYIISIIFTDSEINLNDHFYHE